MMKIMNITIRNATQLHLLVPVVLLVIVHDQSGIKCGVGSQRKFAIFLAHSAESGFCNKKCCILTFPEKSAVLFATKQKL